METSSQMILKVRILRIDSLRVGFYTLNQWLKMLKIKRSNNEMF